MAVQVLRPSGLLRSVPDWQVSLLVTAVMALSLLGLIGFVKALPQETATPTTESIQPSGPSGPQNFSVGEQKSGASSVGQQR